MAAFSHLTLVLTNTKLNTAYVIRHGQLVITIKSSQSTRH